MTDFLPITLYITMVLVPTIPAFLLFKFLPSTGSVEGPLQGLTFKLGGAFAGYFAILLLSYGIMSPMLKERAASWDRYVKLLESSVYQDWRIVGRVDLVGVGALDPNSITVFVRPPDLHIQPDGSFRFEIPMRMRPDGTPDAPMLLFNAYGFVSSTVSLLPVSTFGGATPVQQHSDIKEHMVVIDTPITLPSKTTQPAYKPPAQ
jgi:hypothetical protein